MANSPWHYTTFIDFIDHWQALAAGLFGFAAAIIVVVITLLSERRKSERELDALRRSLGVEIRQNLLQALSAHQSLKRLAQTKNRQITFRMIENVVDLSEPIIFSACAGRIGLLGRQAMDVATIYNLLSTVRATIERFERHRTPDDISPKVVASVAMVLITICEQGSRLLPNLKTGVAAIDNKDQEVVNAIAVAENNWKQAVQEWPEISLALETPSNNDPSQAE